MNIALQRQMDLFFCFLLGLTLNSSQRALKDLLKQRRSSSSSQSAVQHIKTMIMNSSSDDADKCSLLFDCLKELDDRYLIQEIKTQLKSGLRLSPDEPSALMSVLLNPEELRVQNTDWQRITERPRSCDLPLAEQKKSSSLWKKSGIDFKGVHQWILSTCSGCCWSTGAPESPQTAGDTGEDQRNNPQLKNPEEDHISVKKKPSMINSESSKRRKSSESESSSMMFKLRLKKEFECLNEEISPGERRLLNGVFIEPHITEEHDSHIKLHITEEHDSHIRDKRQIMCNNIFEGQNIRRVLMKGEAGIGKTVAVQKFILDWAEEKSNHDIDYIFLIPFQKLNIIRETGKECSFMELLQRCCENTEHLNPESRIMLIFDGLNEFKVPLDFQTTKKITDPNKPASVSDLLTNLMMGNLLPKAQIWITSRPAAANQIPAGFIDRVTEIQGFNDEQKEEYFRKCISDHRMANKVISLIQKSPRINSMCYSPDYCRIITAIPEEIIRTGSSDFPKTLTQMYSKLLLAQMNLSRERRETIIALGKIAFDLLVNSNSLFNDQHLKKYGIRVESVLINSSIIKVFEDKSKYKFFCFMNHRTQEFLAALYAADVINGGKYSQLRHLSSLKLELGEKSFTDYDSLQKVMNIALQRQMDLFFCFLMGLTLESSQRALKDLLTQRRSSSSSQSAVQHIKTMIMNSSSDDADKCSLLFDCLKELDDRYLIQEIKTHLKSGLRLSSALMSVLLNPEEKLDEIKYHQSEELRVTKRNQVLSDSSLLQVHETDYPRITERQKKS